MSEDRTTMRLLVVGLKNAAGALVVDGLMRRAADLAGLSALTPHARIKRLYDPVDLRLGHAPDTVVALSFLVLHGVYMSDLGRPIKAALGSMAATPVVAYDELDQKFGVVKRRWGGSAGGHNGLRSVQRSLGSPDFWRLRIGIDRPASHDPDDVGDYVLADFEPYELDALRDEVADQAWRALADIAHETLQGTETRLAKGAIAVNHQRGHRIPPPWLPV